MWHTLLAKASRNAINAVKNNKRPRNFATGTGIAAANRQVKKAWAKAAREVDGRTMQVVAVTQIGPEGQGIISEEVHDGYYGRICA
jgi:hypothetical protein